MESASLDFDVVDFGQPTYTGPTPGFHGIEVLDAAQVSDHVRSSRFSSLFAELVGRPDGVGTFDLLDLRALVGSNFKRDNHSKEEKEE